MRVECNLKDGIVGDLIEIGLLHLVVKMRTNASTIGVLEDVAGLVDDERHELDDCLVRVEDLPDSWVHVGRHTEEHTEYANVHDADERAIVGATLEQAALEDIGGTSAYAVDALAGIGARVRHAVAQPSGHVWTRCPTTRRLHRCRQHRRDR